MPQDVLAGELTIDNTTGDILREEKTPPPPSEAELKARAIQDLLKKESEKNQILQQFQSPNVQRLVDQRNTAVVSVRDYFAEMPIAEEMSTKTRQEDQLMVDLRVAQEIAGLIGFKLSEKALVAPLGFRIVGEMDMAFIDTTRLGVFKADNNGLNVTLKLKTDKYLREHVVPFPSNQDSILIARNAVAALATFADYQLSAHQQVSQPRA